MRRANRTDDNQMRIVRALREVGAVVIPTTGDPQIGFDLLVLWRGRVYLVEIKDGDKSPSGRKLTENEFNRKCQVESVGVHYHVINSVDAALRLIIGAVT